MSRPGELRSTDLPAQLSLPTDPISKQVSTKLPGSPVQQLEPLVMEEHNCKGRISSNSTAKQDAPT